MPSTGELIRLHITPFNETIYQKIIPTSIRDTNPDTSFHAVQTFPERGFGYLQVSRANADSLRKKLNGMMFKGTKIRIEEARPEKKRKVDTTDDIEIEPTHQKRSKKLEPGQERTLLMGYELPADRHVKRGWVEDKQAGKKHKSGEAAQAKQSLDKRKSLFKTVLPPNKRESGQDKSKVKKDKTSRDKSSRGDHSTVVKEFAQHRNTFAVSSASSAVRKPAVSYEDGKGWVDEDGEVVEGESAQARRRIAMEHSLEGSTNTTLVKSPARDAPISHSPAAQDSSVESSHAEQSESDSDDDEPSSSSHTSTTESQSDGDASSDSDAMSVDVDASAGDQEEEEIIAAAPSVHPLEALYKRGRPGSTGKTDALPPINTSFSFFGGNDEDEPVQEVTGMPPATPHTKQDLEWRTQRSAAPTPDTAAIEGKFAFPFGPSEDEEDSEVEEALAATPVVSTQQSGSKEESAFRKLFFEKRGETDRAWKKRRREAKKLQRQRENRRLSRRAV